VILSSLKGHANAEEIKKIITNPKSPDFPY
jgi:hypothetical protein